MDTWPPWLNSIKGVVLAVFIWGFICPSFCPCHRTEFCDAVFLSVVSIPNPDEPPDLIKMSNMYDCDCRRHTRHCTAASLTLQRVLAAASSTVEARGNRDQYFALGTQKAAPFFTFSIFVHISQKPVFQRQSYVPIRASSNVPWVLLWGQ